MKILIVDDHPLFRAGFHAVLENSSLGATILSVAGLAEALDLLRRDPDIALVLLDVHLSGEDGFRALHVIGERYPTTACIMISGDEQDGIASRALKAGASGFIPKSFTAQQMLSAIQRVLRGDLFVPEKASLSRPEIVPGALTLRQMEVIGMLGQGLSNKEIARALQVAERTVKAHVTAVFEALNVKNRTQAVIAAQRLGYLQMTAHASAQ
jgi:DNA-binding NarL/FixJ family response regulator